MKDFLRPQPFLQVQDKHGFQLNPSFSQLA
nr:MAG TPA: hypothetical protein [Caudoviricetes sp.]